MRCPFCKHNELQSRVVDSRSTDNGFVIRRRRECLNPVCKRRFTSYERIDEVELQVIDDEGNNENFSLEKLRESVALACRKHTLAEEKIDEIVEKTEQEIRTLFEREVKSVFIAKTIMRHLERENPAAFVTYTMLYCKVTRKADLDKLKSGIEDYEKSLEEDAESTETESGASS